MEKDFKERRQFMTTPLHVLPRAGSMLMFPAHLTHVVSPCQGDARPFISAWRIASEPIRGTPYDGPIRDGTEQSA